MPITAPTYEASVNPQAIDAPKSTAGLADLSTQKVDRALDQNYSQGMKIFSAEKERADNTITKEYFSKVSEIKNDLTHNPKSGYTTLHGEAAVKGDLQGTYEKQLNERMAEARASLIKNRNQQMIADRIEADTRNEFRTGIQNHYTQQANVYEGKSAEMGIKSAVDDSSLNWGVVGKDGEQFGKVYDNAKIINAIAMDRYTKMYGPEIAEEMTRGEQSKHYRQVIESMTINTGNAKIAQRFYDDLTKRNGVPSEFPGMIDPGNIDYQSRPIVKMPDGKIASVRSMSIGTDKGDVLIPTVSPDGRIMSNQEAIDRWKATGENLGTFNSAAAADKFAEKYHDRMGPSKPKFTSDDDQAVQKILKSSGTRGESQDVADMVLKSGKGLTGMMEMIAKQNLSPEVRAMAEQRVEHFYDLRERENNKAITTMLDNDIKLLQEQFDESGALPSAYIMDIIPPARWDKYDLKQQNHLRNVWAGAGVVSDPNELIDEYMIANASPETFLAKDFNDADNSVKYAPKDRANLMKMQQDIRSGSKQAKKKLHGIITPRKAVENVAAQASIPDKQYDEFEEAVNERAEAQMAASGKTSLSTQEWNSIAEDFATEVIVDNWADKVFKTTPKLDQTLFGQFNAIPKYLFGASKKRIFQVNSIKDVPEDFQTAFINNLPVGVSASTDDIINAYRDAVMEASHANRRR